MRKRSSRPGPLFPAAVCAVALLISSPSWAVQLRTAWASGYEASESPPANGEDALGRPDGLTAGLSCLPPMPAAPRADRRGIHIVCMETICVLDARSSKRYGKFMGDSLLTLQTAPAIVTSSC